MYWQKRFDREDPDREIEAKLLEIEKAIRIMAIVECLGNFIIRAMLSTKESSADNAKTGITGNIVYA